MSVIARSMVVLDILAEAGVPVSLTDLAHQSGLPLTTTHRLCAELLTEHVIERSESGGLQIGGRLWDLGRRYARTERLRAAAGRYLHDLYEVTRATVELAQILDDGLAVVERIAAPDAALFDRRERLDRVALEASAAGIAVLASAPYGSGEVRGSGSGIAPDVAKAVRDARATGIAKSPRAGLPGGYVLAAGITDSSGPVGAVAVAATGESEVRSFGPSLLVTARRISATLARPAR